ncbi:MAG TPA: IS110 family transposase [Anaerolineales bacterium]
MPYRRWRFREAGPAEAAAQDESIPLLVQVPGVAMLTAITILAAIGDIRRFPSAKKLVGYAGLGARVHDSGEKHSRGGITKQGRRDLRIAMVSAANHAAALGEHPFWKREFQRLEIAFQIRGLLNGQDAAQNEAQSRASESCEWIHPPTTSSLVEAEAP